MWKQRNEQTYNLVIIVTISFFYVLEMYFLSFSVYSMVCSFIQLPWVSETQVATNYVGKCSILLLLSINPFNYSITIPSWCSSPPLLPQNYRADL